MGSRYNFVFINENQSTIQVVFEMGTTYNLGYETVEICVLNATL